MTFSDKECKGCNGADNFCALSSPDCPCVECLIKSVCEEHCEKYFSYMENGLNKIERLTQIIYRTGSSFWIQKAYLVDMEALNVTRIGKGDNNDDNE